MGVYCLLLTQMTQLELKGVSEDDPEHADDPQAVKSGQVALSLLGAHDLWQIGHN